MGAKDIMGYCVLTLIFAGLIVCCGLYFFNMNKGEII
ncbi:TIGR00366 family protein [Campylobacter bilis]